MPKMTHPKSNKTIEVAAAQVGMYASQGWVEKPAAKKTSARSTTTNQAPAAENKE